MPQIVNNVVADCKNNLRFPPPIRARRRTEPEPRSAEATATEHCGSAM
jgi:hypothetical protein